MSKQQFIKSSSKRLGLVKIKTAAGVTNGAATGGLLYPLSCLALGILLGGGVGAVLAPQMLHAEDAGIYDFIRKNNEMMRGRAPSPRYAVQPRAYLPRFSYGWHRERMMPARLPPPHYGTSRRADGERYHRLHLPQPAEIGPEQRECGTCELARYAPLEAILHDKTLRAGDTVMMSMGAVVFRGADHLPYTAADFVDFRQSRLLNKKERQIIDADLGLSQGAAAMRAFDDRARAQQTTPTVAKAGEMRSFYPIPQETR
jgi:hypothetical protein